MPLSQCVQVQIAAADRQEAGRIAELLLTRRLAACVQLMGPLHSRYWWHGELEEAEEWLCLAKTTKERTAELIEAVGTAHSYETPEVIVTPVVDGSVAYLQWVVDEVEKHQPGA